MSPTSPETVGDLAVAIDVDAIAPARDRLRTALAEAGCDEPLVDDAVAVASELVMNALLHGTSDETDEVRLGWVVDEGVVTIHVDDAGGSTTPTVHAPHPTAGGGRGLRLVEQLTSTWSFTRSEHGTRVTAVLSPGG